MKKTHELLKELRDQHKYTQKDIANHLGTTQQTYSYYELGLREIPSHHIVTLSHLYKVSADYLLSIDNPYTGHTDLSQEYIKGMSLHDIMFNIQKLDSEKRKSLVQFIKFLNTQDGLD
ncbi:MAG: helix-turn-helix transcriptional regulator [Lachnospiraceae bacterium]|nr:helix-turn-helix transcriptional regulator [Lachnospiraceae bacterium]